MSLIISEIRARENILCQPVENAAACTNLHSLCTFLIVAHWISNYVLSPKEVMYQSQKTLFEHIYKHREQSWKYDGRRRKFDKIRCVWKCSKPLSWVFDISAKSKQKLKRNVKIYANQDRIYKLWLHHGQDFLCWWIIMSLRIFYQNIKKFPLNI